MAPPVIHGEPKIVQDAKANTVSLEVIVSGILPEKTKWFLGEKEIQPTETYVFSQHDEGGKRTLLKCEIKNFDKELAGSYKAKFCSSDGENSATFTVKAGNAPEFHDKPHIVQRDGGNIIVIKVRAKSHLEMTAEWFKDDKPLKATDRIKMVTKKDDKDKEGFQFLLEIHGPVKEDQAKMGRIANRKLQRKSTLALTTKECTNHVDVSVSNESHTSLEQGNSKSKSGAAKIFKEHKGRKRKISVSSDDTIGSNVSEDEWEEVDFADERNYGANPDRTIEVTIKAAKSVETESKWARFIRQQVNRKIRERQINCHKMHLLCYIAHLRTLTRTLIQHETLISLCLSLIPEGYITAAKHEFDVAIAERFMKWFRSTFRFTKAKHASRNCVYDSQMKRLEDLIGEHAYEDDRDLASIASTLCSEHTEAFVKTNINNDDNSVVWERKLYEVTKKVQMKTDDFSEHSRMKKCREPKQANATTLRESGGNNSDQIASTKKRKTNSGRNYWVEYWDCNNTRWICMDPWCGTVDLPESLEENATAPMHYVISIDNYMGMRDVTARYASKFLSAETRRLRVDSLWWTDTLKIYRSKDRRRERLEDVAIHNELLSKPKPSTVAEYKNHPLYVLKKDILKYEAIYPEDQPPIGRIRGYDIYPRSSVFHLDGALNWMKHARMVKPGEKPYKIVSGRMNNRAVSEQREPRFLELYGYWQTEPYVPPKVINGRIPRNEFGNLYVYKSSMVPEGCIHLRLNGLLAISRQLEIDCVPAVVGWEFHKGGNHPILDGCIVLKQHEEVLREAWKEFHNRKQIAAEKCADEKLKNEGSEVLAANDAVLSWPQTIFNLPGNSGTNDH
ncbi:unnamed protein product [Litomosoides sigmodontis]|uniref:DNA repair protein Rad4 n=1 Tax=Litomosoides sigmodontis TaxID=42156 RepID=A0A3P6SC03_LITSI|nr:unnamed protein product [Litomosoides sigmodontis]